jgi:hypothetical protein
MALMELLVREFVETLAVNAALAGDLAHGVIVVHEVQEFPANCSHRLVPAHGHHEATSFSDADASRLAASLIGYM